MCYSRRETQSVATGRYIKAFHREVCSAVTLYAAVILNAQAADSSSEADKRTMVRDVGVWEPKEQGLCVYL